MGDVVKLKKIRRLNSSKTKKKIIHEKKSRKVRRKMSIKTKKKLLTKNYWMKLILKN
jgi:hypothetical protein